jgi:hypothetical protein
MANWHKSYMRIWKGRTFDDIDEAMENELLDQLNHPRLRKKVEVKFFESVRRVNESNLSNEEKVQLIDAYIHCFEQLKQKD